MMSPTSYIAVPHEPKSLPELAYLRPNIHRVPLALARIWKAFPIILIFMAPDELKICAIPVQACPNGVNVFPTVAVKTDANMPVE